MKNKFCQNISFFLKKFYKHLLLMFLVLCSGFLVYQYKDSFLEMNQQNMESFKKILNFVISSEKIQKIPEKEDFFINKENLFYKCLNTKNFILNKKNKD